MVWSDGSPLHGTSTDLELVLKTSGIMGRVLLVQASDFSSEVSGGNLCVSTSDGLQHCIMDEDVLLLVRG